MGIVSSDTIYIALLVIISFLLLGAGALFVVRQASKDVRDGTPVDVVSRILDVTDVLAKMALPMAADTATLTDDQLLIQYFETRGYTITGSPETGYTITPPVQQ